MRVYARQCEAFIMDNDEAQAFVERHHRQGSAKVTTKLYSVGLRHKDQVVAIAQFCAPRTEAMSRKYTTELLRMAFADDTRVVGGASKLVSFFKLTYKPTDIFTYQDTTGEITSVYEHAGFRLVSQDRRKRYLVAPGVSLETGSRKEVLGLAYAVRFGPDRIIGSKLGEQFHEDGSRKSNLELFQELGWQIEETSGDRVYEWLSPDATFYVYKTTASDSDKYYYGVSHVKKAEASKADCAAHVYFGSGDPKSVSNKFVNWKKTHAASLQKEVIATFSRKAEAFALEKKLIGESWRTDPNCMNSAAGGRGHSKTSPRMSEKSCAVHGLVMHNGATCMSCVAQARQHTSFCEVHGETPFTGDACARCAALDRIHLSECAVHGSTKHRGAICYKCEQQAAVTMKLCPIHGLTKHQGNTCGSCTAESTNSMRECTKHGLTKHQNETCFKCMTEAKNRLQVCAIHGETKHYGSTCAKCALASTYSDGECSLHGVTRLRRGNCVKCANQKTAHTRFHKEPKADCRYCVQ